MTLLKLDLTLGLRHMATAVISRVEKSDLDVSRKISHIRKELDLRQADHKVRKLGERLSELGLGVPFDAFIDSTYLAEDVRNSLSGGRRDRLLEMIRSDILVAADKAPFTLDQEQVAWLLGRVDEVELSDKVKEELEALAQDVLAIMDAAPFTLDFDRIGWLLEEVKKVDLSTAFGTGPDGRRVEIQLRVELGQRELLVSLADALASAEDVKKS